MILNLIQINDLKLYSNMILNFIKIYDLKFYQIYDFQWN